MRTRSTAFYEEVSGLSLLRSSPCGYGLAAVTAKSLQSSKPTITINIHKPKALNQAMGNPVAWKPPEGEQAEHA